MILDLSLSAVQQTLINQMYLHVSDCDLVIARHEIQMTDKCLGRGGWEVFMKEHIVGAL